MVSLSVEYFVFSVKSGAGKNHIFRNKQRYFCQKKIFDWIKFGERVLRHLYVMYSTRADTLVLRYSPSFELDARI